MEWGKNGKPHAALSMLKYVHNIIRVREQDVVIRRGNGECGWMRMLCGVKFVDGIDMTVDGEW
jgi:hypothetical protein